MNSVRLHETAASWAPTNDVVDDGKSACLAHCFHERDKIAALILFLDTCENHLGANNVFLWVDKVLEEVFVGPDYAGRLVGFRVNETVGGARLLSDDAPQGRSLFRCAALLNGMALGTLAFEKLGTLLHVTVLHLDVGLGDDHGCSKRVPKCFQAE